MDPVKKIEKRLNVSMYAFAGANILAFIFFLIAYVLSEEIWFLVAGLALIAATVVYRIFLQRIRGKLRTAMKNGDKNE